MQYTEGIVLDRRMRLRQHVHSNQQRIRDSTDMSFNACNTSCTIAWFYAGAIADTSSPFDVAFAQRLQSHAREPHHRTDLPGHAMLEMPVALGGASQRDQRNASQTLRETAAPRNAKQRACNTHRADSIRSTAGARLDGRRKKRIKSNAPKTSCYTDI